ncbi:MAG: hypothetical protein V4773_19300 [Verrucomicrobiota bacterium]
MTIVEVMIALFLLVTLMLGFISAFLHSRRVTEASVLHAATTSLLYGIVEQLKGIDYTELLPSSTVDENAPTATTPPYVRVRINQELTQWLRVVYTPSPGTPRGPTTTPAVTATATSLSAIDNVIGPLALSSTAGTAAQRLTLVLWIWIDEIPDVSRDVTEVKRVTVVYTYSYNDGRAVRTIRDREVFLRTRYDQ